MHVKSLLTDCLQRFTFVSELITKKGINFKHQLYKLKIICLYVTNNLNNSKSQTGSTIIQSVQMQLKYDTTAILVESLICTEDSTTSDLHRLQDSVLPS